MAEKKSTKKTTVTKTRKNVVEDSNNGIQQRSLSERVIPDDIDLNMLITVKNGFHGVLVYISKKTGERFIWDSFGDEQDIELGELKSAKGSSAKQMFINNWFLFDEQPWVPEYLGLGAYYKHTLGITDVEKLHKKSADEISKIVGEMSDGQKNSLKYRVKQLVRDGEIDSVKAIRAFEEALNVELIEK